MRASSSAPALPPRARLTRQRQVVLEAISQLDGGFTLIELYDRARTLEPRLGLATVYRTIELLRRAGTVRPLLAQGRAQYVRCHPGHHHHLVCLSCGSVQEADVCAAPPDEELKRLYGFAAEGHELDIYGTCGKCTEA
jgi:Fur family transcriptional regulator, ferric uptake regulator